MLTCTSVRCPLKCCQRRPDSIQSPSAAPDSEPTRVACFQIVASTAPSLEGDPTCVLAGWLMVCFGLCRSRAQCTELLRQSSRTCWCRSTCRSALHVISKAMTPLKRRCRVTRPSTSSGSVSSAGVVLAGWSTYVDRQVQCVLTHRQHSRQLVCAHIEAGEACKRKQDSFKRPGSGRGSRGLCVKLTAA